MAFTRVKPANWALNEKLTSAQINALDVDHANAVDKTSAGDTVSGTLTLAATGKVVASNAGAEIKTSVASGIQTNIAAGLISTVAGGIQSNAAGGIKLAGGATDWVTFSATRSRTIGTMIGYHTGYNGWSNNITGSKPVLLGPGNTARIDLPFPLHNGATLATITLSVIIASGHTGVPAVLPSFVVRRMPSDGSGGIPGSLGSSAVFPTPADVTAYIAGGAVQSWTFTATTNNVIDTSGFVYFLTINDESGTNAIAGNAYLTLITTYNTISDMRFA